MTAKKRFLTCEICGDRARRINCEKRKFMAKFPLDEARCRQWVKVVGKEDLIYVPIEKLHTLKYVCGNHFENRDFNRNRNRLKKSAIPSKNLKTDPLPDEMLLEFPCHIHSNIDVTMDYVSQGICDNEALISQVKATAEPNNSVSENEILHKFPNPEKDAVLFRNWLYKVGGDIMGLENGFIFKRRRVCHIHFETRYHTRSKMLSADALPTLYLSGSHNTLHKFPNPKKENDRFNEWLYSIGGDILSMDSEQIYKNRRVCQAHFAEIHCCRYGRISNIAVPLVNMAVEDPTLHHGYSRKEHVDHTYYKVGESTSTDGPSTSQDVPNKPATRKIEESVVRSIYDANQTISLSKYIEKVSQETDYHLDDGGIVEDDQTAETLEAVKEERPFSWQQPSAVVPCDEEMLNEIDAGRSVDLERELHDPPEQPIEKGNYRCDVCSDSIVGFRYTCVQCADFDICGSCEARGAHPLHYVLRVPGQRPHAEVQAALLQIRRVLLADAIIQFTPDEDVEVKKEPSCDLEDPIEAAPGVEQTTEDSIVEDRTVESSFEAEDEKISKPTVSDTESSDADSSDDDLLIERGHTNQAILNVVQMPLMKTRTTKPVAKKRPSDMATTSWPKHTKKVLVRTVQPNILETLQRSVRVQLKKITAAEIKATLHKS